MKYDFSSILWQWQGEASWYFISLPSKYYDEIKELSDINKRGFGSVKVEVKVRNSIWKTSIFPDSKSKTYLLPIKKSIRKTENIEAGDSINVTIKLLVS